MQKEVITSADLIALFGAKAGEPPPKENQLLVRHFQCRESLKASQCLADAMDRYVAEADQVLPTAAELLFPPA
ncbi:MAG TPA: hypothetical protein VGR96_13935 [Acidobacteriaceae bacterium]|nr:hypothetical protein [Acidobacteriaceae bacterium]